LLRESSIRVELNAFEFLETIIYPNVTALWAMARAAQQPALVFFEA